VCAAESKVAPSLAGNAKELERSLASASLSKHLKQRPSRTDLESNGVLPHEP
jgi:hypothetical protein